MVLCFVNSEMESMVKYVCDRALRKVRVKQASGQKQMIVEREGG
jgi:hypothetical protein